MSLPIGDFGLPIALQSKIDNHKSKIPRTR